MLHSGGTRQGSMKWGGPSLSQYCFILSYNVASESVIKPCIKNDNPLVDYICELRRNIKR